MGYFVRVRREPRAERKPHGKAFAWVGTPDYSPPCFRRLLEDVVGPTIVLEAVLDERRREPLHYVGGNLILADLPELEFDVTRFSSGIHGCKKVPINVGLRSFRMVRVAGQGITLRARCADDPPRQDSTMPPPVLCVENAIHKVVGMAGEYVHFLVRCILQLEQIVVDLTPAPCAFLRFV